MARPRPNLIEDPVGPVLLRLAFPMIWSMLAVMTFNVVDSFYIGRLGPTPLAAIGFTFPVVFFVTGTAMGMGIGLSSVVSRAVGEGNHRRVSELTTRGLMLAFLVVVAFAGLGIAGHDRLFALLGAQPEMIALIRSYMIPWLAGIGFLVIPMVGNSAIRATGDSVTPSIIMMISGGLNVVLDPLLIFGLGPFPRLELRGAAIATVLAYSVTFVAAFYVLIHREKLIRFERPRWRPLLESWGRILHVGLPAVGTNLLVPFANGILTRILAELGPVAVAAYGVGTRVESLAMAGSYAMSTAVAAFAGQNIGARRFDRIAASMRFGLKYCLFVSLGAWLVLALAADPIARMFTDDPEIIRILRPYLWLVPLSHGALGFMLLAAATFNAAGRPAQSVVIFTTRLVVLTVPLAWAGSRWAGVTGVFSAIFIGNVGTGLLAHFLIHRALRQPERRL